MVSATSQEAGARQNGPADASASEAQIREFSSRRVSDTTDQDDLITAVIQDSINSLIDTRLASILLRATGMRLRNAEFHQRHSANGEPVNFPGRNAATLKDSKRKELLRQLDELG